MQDTSLTPDKVLNSLIPFCGIVQAYTSYKLSKWCVLWLKLTGMFAVL